MILFKKEPQKHYWVATQWIIYRKSNEVSCSKKKKKKQECL